MGKPNDSGDKNEKPTPKKLKDARKEGNVAKSRDLSQTAMTLVWSLILLGFADSYADQLGDLCEKTWIAIGNLGDHSIYDVAAYAMRCALWLTLAPLCAASIIGILIEFLQVGPLISFKKLSPKGSHINPAEGFKRMFSKDNLFEVVKSILKTLLIALLVVQLATKYLNDSLLLPLASATRTIELSSYMMMQLCFWVAALFGFLSIVDILYQKHSHQKRLMMSLYDIRQEHKQSEGDPQLKGKRKQLHREWSMHDIIDASRSASAVVVNPTHIAIALRYEPEEFALPVISAKAEGQDAVRMREAALAAGVPVLRHIPLARELNFRGDYDEVVPEDMFDAVAEVLVWARQTHRQCASNPSLPLYHEYDVATDSLFRPVNYPA